MKKEGPGIENHQSDSANLDISCLDDTEWLSGDVINAYSNIINRQFKETVYIFSTYFYQSLVNRGVDNMNGWTQNVNIFEKKYVFFPIHENSHWYLILLNNIDKALYILDPYVPLTNLKFPKSHEKDFIKASEKENYNIGFEHEKRLNIILHEYILMHHQCPLNIIYTVSVNDNIPKQTNDYDCGVFLLAFMKYTVLEAKFEFETEDMPSFRYIFKDEIINSKVECNVSMGNHSSNFSNTQNKEQNDLEENTNRAKKNSSTNVDKPPHFENRNSTMCWLNSMVQLLLKVISNIEQTSYLKEMIENYNLNINYTQSTQNLRRELALKVQELNVGQQDPFDFFVALQEFSNMEQESIVTPFTIFTKGVVECTNNSSHQSVSYSTEPHPYVSLDIPTDNSAIHHIIEQHFSEGSYIADWRCSSCGNLGGTKRTYIQEGLTPNFILVKFKRYGISSYGRGFKIKTPINPPLGFTIQTQDSSFYPYNLCGVLTHIGNQINSGHYITEVKRNNIWWKCNDDKISETSFDTLSKHAYAFLFEKL